jgi:archaellum component FlaC
MGDEMSERDRKRRMARTQDVLERLDRLADVTETFSQSNKELASEVKGMNKTIHAIDKRVVVTEQQLIGVNARMKTAEGNIKEVKGEVDKQKQRQTWITAAIATVSGHIGGIVSKFWPGG